MKKNNYTEHLDKIRCSPEFQKKMTELLSSEPDGEYAYIVSDVETVSGAGFRQHWAAVAAAFALIIGIGGVFVFTRNDEYAPSVSETEVSDSGSEQVQIYETAEMSIYRNTTTIINNTFAGKSGVHNFGEIPEEAAEGIYKLIGTTKYTEVSENQFSDSENRIDMKFTGENEFEYSVTESGIVAREQNGSRIFYRSESNVYAGILDIIARHLPYFDFSKLIEGDYGISISEAVNAYIDQTERTHLSSAGDAVMFYYDGIFTAYINKSGLITVEYSLPETGGIQYRFSSSPELYNKMKEITEEKFIAVELEKTKEKDNKITSEKFVRELEESLSGECRFSYHYDESQGIWSRCLMNSEPDISSFIDEIRKIEWKICDAGQYDSLMRRNVFVINNWRFNNIPMIMNEKTGTVYIAEGEYTSGYQEALREMIATTDKGDIIYQLASYPKRVSEIQADISVNSTDRYGRISGTGTIDWNFNENSGSILISDNGNDVKYIRENGEWKLINETESAGSIFYDIPVFDYTRIYYMVLDYLTDSVEHPDRMSDFSVEKIEKIEKYKEGIFIGDGNDYKYHFIYNCDDIS
ncbi:MAG: hypothetical protein K2J37_05465, partial [Ruminococcus sp.]|nr:hypothetical protein [Ruminococcus sp.]